MQKTFLRLLPKAVSCAISKAEYDAQSIMGKQSIIRYFLDPVVKGFGDSLKEKQPLVLKNPTLYDKSSEQ